MIIPHENERDLKEIPQNIKADLDIRPVRWIDEVLEIALQHKPEPLSDDEYERIDSESNKTTGDPTTRINTH